MLVCPLQKQEVVSDYKSVFMEENKWQEAVHIREKWLLWKVAL